jgi:hypothetical protein
MRELPATMLLTAAVTMVSACAGATAEAEPAAPIEQGNDVAAVPAADDTVHANAPAPEDYRPLLREIAASYREWGMVDNQFHWAPGLCALPAEGVAHLSNAESPAAHASKVFVLFASDPAAYWRAAGITDKLPSTLTARPASRTRDDVVQVLVKDSFVPARPGEGRTSMGVQVQPARRGEETFFAGDPIGLFVMAQLSGKPAGTDEGWIYGTVTPTGEVTEAGVIASCRDCHDDQADRIFGVPLQWKQH